VKFSVLAAMVMAAGSASAGESIAFQWFEYAGRDATLPSPDHAAWICVQMQRWGQVAGGDPMVQKAWASFRLDLYRDALQGAPA